MLDQEKAHQEKVQLILNELESEAVDIAAIAENHHPSEIAAAIDRIESDNRIIQVFYQFGTEEQAEILPHLEDRARELILSKTPAVKLGNIIEEMNSDDAADILADMSKEQAEGVLRVMSDETEQEVVRLMEFEDETAGHLMQTELVSVQEDFTVAETIDKIRSLADIVEDLHNIFIVDRTGKLTGVLPLRRLILFPPTARVSDLVEGQQLVYVTANTDQEHVAGLFKRYDLVSLPVVGPDMTLLGRILIDDVVDVMEEETDEDILIMAGANDEALVQTRSAAEMARFRLPWLGSSLLGGFVTGTLVWQFEGTISEALALTAFIPIVMGISGNVGSQSSALVIRGIATGRIDLGSLKRYFIKELKVGLLLGLACGAVAGLVAQFWQGSPAFGLIVGLSIFISIEIAALMGTAIPFFFKWINIDPAIAGGPIVLALNDISGLTIFFGMATAMLGYLK